MFQIIKKLEQCKKYDDVFNIVKRSVSDKLNLHRAGLTLVIGNLPTNIGAYHVIGSNSIVLNRVILNIIKNTKSKQEFNAYLYHILLHEYLHSLGYTNEEEVRTLVEDISKETFGEGHYASIISKRNLSDIFPEIAYSQSNIINNFEVIADFDRTSMSYIG
jgi:hypothetical protein